MPSSESSSHAAGDVSPAAETLFFARLEAVGAADWNVEELCAERPDLAHQLRELDACYQRGLSALTGDARPADLTDAPTDRYQLRREIESGGMGTVFEVWDRNLQRALAMKVAHVAPDSAGQDEWRRRQARLRNEARVLGQLVHPAIVPLHDLGESATGSVFFTMQLVCGRDLGAILAEVARGGSEWTLTRLLGVLHRVCEAMAYAHSRGVLHRDLKPGNIMVGPFGETYVLDWGLAKILAADAPAADDAPTPTAATTGDVTATQPGAVLGTPAYMSPEQAAGSIADLDERSDIYSVGAILYHVLGGQRPYSDSDGPMAAIHAVRAGPPPDLHALARSLPSELQAIANRAMARDPGARYQTMRAMADDLRAYLEGHVVQAHRTGALVELEKWVRRNKGAAAAILAVLFGLAAVLVLQVHANRELQLRDYGNQMALASHAYQRDDILGMQACLAECSPDLRGWEWSAMQRLSDTSSLTLTGHQDIVLCADQAPDGRTLVTGSRDRTLRLWDAEQGTCTHVWTFDDWVSGAAFLDARRLLVVVGRRLLELDVDRKTTLRVSRHEVDGTHIDMALSPDGARLLISYAGRAELWRTDTLAPCQQVVAGLFGIGQVAWSNDGSLLFIGGRDRDTDGARASLVRVHDAATGAVRHALAGHDHWVGCVAPSADGRLLASACSDGRVLIWDLQRGALLRELPHKWPGLTPLGWTADGQLLTGGWPSIEVWDIHSGQRRQSLVGHTEPVAHLLVRSPLVVASGTDGVTKTWRLEATESLELPASTSGRGLALRPGTSQFAVGSAAGHVEIWDAASRSRIRATTIVCNRTYLDYTPDGRRLVTGDRDGRLAIWDAETDAPLARREAHAGPIAALAVHPFLPRCVTAGSDATVRLHDLDTLTELWQVPAGTAEWPDGAHGCVFSPDGTRIAAGANDERLRIIDAATGSVLQELRIDPGETTYASPCFSPDGNTVLATVWGRKSQLVAWRLDTGRVRWSRPGSRQVVQAPLFAQDGSRVLTCTGSGALLVFAAESGRRLVSLPGPSPERVLASALWGDVVVAASERGLRFWDGTPVESR